MAEAIQLAQREGAIVKWGQKLNGLYFDATVRRTYGSTECLIVVTCIESASPLTKTQISDYLTQSQEAGAHIAILVSSSGFQPEAADGARGSILRLLDKDMSESQSADTLSKAFRPILLIHQFHFHTNTDGFNVEIPEEEGLLRLFLEKTIIEGPGIRTTPDGLLEVHTEQIAKLAGGHSQIFKVPFPKGTEIIHPHTKKRLGVTAFSCRYQLISELDISTTRRDETSPYLSSRSIEEDLVRRNPAARASELETGFDTRFRAGRYYYNPKLDFSYYCEKVEKGQATVFLVESVQAGQLVQAQFHISKSQARQLVEITNEEEIARLATLYEKLALSTMSLEERFKIFAKGLEKAECIDDITLTTEQKAKHGDKKKADYFFDDRTIICELKSLQEDPSPKIDRELEPYKQTEDWPIIYGSVSLDSVLGHLPNGLEIKAKIITSVTDRIEDIIEVANRQIRATKETFGLTHSSGLLIILNEQIAVLSPESIIYRVGKSLEKRTSSGDIKYPHVSVVLIISTAHYTQLKSDLVGFPVLTLWRDLPISEAEKMKGFLHTIVPKWSEFEKRPLVEMETRDFSERIFQSLGQEKRADRQKSRKKGGKRSRAR